MQQLGCSKKEPANEDKSLTEEIEKKTAMKPSLDEEKRGEERIYSPMRLTRILKA